MGDSGAAVPPAPPAPPPLPVDPREPYLKDEINPDHWRVYLSAMIKSIRRGYALKAVHWGCILDRLGHTELVWRRLMIHMSEDIGLADRTLPASLMALRQSHRELEAAQKHGGARQSLVHALLLLATARKNRSVDHLAMIMYEQPLEEFGAKGMIPDEAFDHHGRVGRELGRGYEFFFDHGARLRFRGQDLQQISRDEQAEWEAEARNVMLEKEKREREREGQIEAARMQEEGQG